MNIASSFRFIAAILFLSSCKPKELLVISFNPVTCSNCHKELSQSIQANNKNRFDTYIMVDSAFSSLQYKRRVNELYRPLRVKIVTKSPLSFSTLNFHESDSLISQMFGKSPALIWRKDGKDVFYPYEYLFDDRGSLIIDFTR
jgi:hypothetical protein